MPADPASRSSAPSDETEAAPLTDRQRGIAEKYAHEPNRLLFILGAYRDEERRAGTTFNEANAIALDTLIQELESRIAPAVRDQTINKMSALTSYQPAPLIPLDPLGYHRLMPDQPPHQPRCADCRYFMNANECHRHAPVAVAAQATVAPFNRAWPQVLSFEWCGDFELAPAIAVLSRRQRCDARLESDAVPAFDADGESIQYRGPEIPGAALPVPAQEAEAERLLRMIRANCRVVYYPPEVGTYVIEHAPLARKDAWDAIVWALRDRSQDQPSAPTVPETSDD